MKDYIVIGAGLSGLLIADKLQEISKKNVLILEKSRGVGGRMATRRTLSTSFDHGAQFYKLNDDIFEFHQLWHRENLTQKRFNSPKGEYWNSPKGMTALAKFIAKNLEIKLESQVDTIRMEENSWLITNTNNESFATKSLIFSSPLPQSIAILERSKILQSINPENFLKLKNIIYSKALIGLITFEDEIIINDEGYQEYLKSDFFSIADQKKKDISIIPALTVTMSEDFSEEFFDQPNELISEKVLTSFKALYPHAKIKGFELKKWRFCKPSGTFEAYFFEALPNLFLIGDAFGGSSLLGAARSASGLFQYLLN